MKNIFLEYGVIITSSLFFLLAWLSTIMTILNRRKFDEICHLFQKELGYLPVSMKFWTNAGFPLSTQKTAYLFLPLIFKKNSIFLKGFNIQEVEFIKKIPRKLTRWIILKNIALLFSLAMFLISGILMKVIYH